MSELCTAFPVTSWKFYYKLYTVPFSITRTLKYNYLGTLALTLLYELQIADFVLIGNRVERQNATEEQKPPSFQLLA